MGTGKVTRLPAPTAAAVAFVLEAEGQADALEPPDELADAILPALKARNLIAIVPEPAVLARGFAARRATPDRLALLAERSAGTPLLVLIETKASFYAQIEGRYRWTVRARVTLARPDALGEAQTEDFEIPVVLRFDHQREREALAEAAPLIAKDAGTLLDRFLGGMPGATQAQAGSRARPAEAIYFVLVDRFANGDRGNDAGADLADPQGWHGGDLAGLRGKLGYLADLGFTTVWISPVFAARAEKFDGHGAFHGYWTQDLGKTEPRFGREEELVGLAADLRARGMRLYLDLVVNHVAWDAPLRAEHPTWFHGKGPIQDWNDAAQLETHDVHGLPDLALERDDVYAYVAGHARGWIDRVRPDGFRLDAVRHVAHATWSRLAHDLHAHAGEGFVLLGELLDGAPHALARTFDAGFDALFDFPLGFAIVEAICDGAPAGKIAAIFSQDRLYADPTRLVTLLDNHDLPRVASRCGGDLDKVRSALVVQLTSRGIPSITYGTEAGLAGAKEPENRGDMTFGAAPLAGVIQESLAARRAHPALTGGRTQILAADRSFAAWARLADDEALVVAVNTGAGARTITFAGTVVDVPARSTRVEPIAGAFPVRAPAERTVEIVAEAAPGATGDELLLVGGGPELGNWDPAKAPRFSGGARPVLTLILPAPGAYGMKLVVRRRDGTVTWQDGMDRILFVPEGAGPDRWTIGWRGDEAWRRSS